MTSTVALSGTTANGKFSSEKIILWSDASYNQPRLNELSIWSPCAVIFATSATFGTELYSISITKTNSIYVLDHATGEIHVWTSDTSNSTNTIAANFTKPAAMFVTSSGDVFVDNGNITGEVDRWMAATNTSVPVMNVTSSCYGLFVDVSNSLYCSMHFEHKVVKRYLGDTDTTLILVAGNGTSGSQANKLSNPVGIFVDTNFDLYVADYGNNRIQLFASRASNAITKASSSYLNRPSSVVLDQEKKLYVVDSHHHRIVRVSDAGFQCIVGCYSSAAATSELFFPWSMAFDSHGNIYVVDRNNSRIEKFLLLNKTTDISYNQPSLDGHRTWNPTMIIFADNDTVDAESYGIFVTKSNYVYSADYENHAVHVWSNTSNHSQKTIYNNLINSASIFVTLNADVFVDNGNITGQVDQWMAATNTSVPVMNVTSSCYGLFVDVSNSLYCSMHFEHKVVKRWLDGDDTLLTTVAGNGTSGSQANKLSNPVGIFVDTNLDLYVADYGNDRVQLYRFGDLTGITVAGNSSVNRTLPLDGPTCILLDGYKYLFIVDSNKNRIVRSTSSDFLCIIGCYRSSLSSNELFLPWSMAFDSYGNIFVIDRNHRRIGQYILLNNTEDISYNHPSFHTVEAWNPNAIVFASNNTLGTELYSISITKTNSIYVLDHTSGKIRVWTRDTSNSTNTIAANFTKPAAMFVTSSGDVFVDNGNITGEVDRWMAATNTSVPVMNVTSSCYGLFVDVSNSLYCSMHFEHKVVKRWLGGNDTLLTTVAGNGTSGSQANTLSNPVGIFVDTSFSLYVADYGNDRVQVFTFGNIQGRTEVSGNLLNGPSGIILDNSSYLFIVDSNNNRIIRSTHGGFQCIIGCYSSSSTTSELVFPWSMAFDSHGNIYVVDRNTSRIEKFLLLKKTTDISYNQPSFCPLSTWNESVLTLANISTIRKEPSGLFVTKRDLVYVTQRDTGRIRILVNSSWSETTLSAGYHMNSSSIFVSTNNDIFVDNGDTVGQVDKWTANQNICTPAMYVNSSCYDLFVDITNSLYCSIQSQHKVVKRWLAENDTILTTVAGNGTADLKPNRLSQPAGIFVHMNLRLYVADYGNDRIQLFLFGEINGSTIAGNKSTNYTITLNGPTDVLLNEQNYLFIVDSNNHRIVRSGPNGFYCIIGCNGSGSSSNQLSYPDRMAFDRNGSIFVTDTGNSRIQKFSISTLRCNLPTSQQPVFTSTALSTQTSTFPHQGISPTNVSDSTTHISSSMTIPSTSTSSFPVSAFIPPSCTSNTIGITCNISSTPCHIMQPCQNDGSCFDNKSNSNSYDCLCLQGFNGSMCENDHRPCQPNTCFNRGECNATSNEGFKCSCESGWTGDHCERQVNYCRNATCVNGGVCRPLLGGYKCECLSGSYSGQHCEIISQTFDARLIVSKAIGYTGYVIVGSVCLFVMMLDVLKYVFGIDPARAQLERIRRRQRPNRSKRKRPAIIQRFTYVNK
ncbi:unnamed protein product [Adineta ricciae]|uniref:EGF-like domain-containing protein n=1 Tax=Adineta ricciae TaxID=249248 RepID=A0A815B1G7_ADIRI|nr:unnamed protein product [Adineta ricciae]